MKSSNVASWPAVVLFSIAVLSLSLTVVYMSLHQAWIWCRTLISSDTQNAAQKELL